MSDDEAALKIPVDKVPGLVETLLTSDSQEALEKAYEDLTTVTTNQEDLAYSVVFPRLADLLALAKRTNIGYTLRTYALDIAWRVIGLNDTTRTIGRGHFQTFIDLLFIGKPEDYPDVPRLLEIVFPVEVDRSFDAKVVGLFKEQLYTIPSDPNAVTPDDYRKLSATVEATAMFYLFSHSNLIRLATQAGCIEFIVALTTVPDAACRKSAVAGLASYLNHIEYADEDPYPGKDLDDLRRWLFTTILDRFSDNNPTVSTAALEFLENATIPAGIVEAHPTLALDAARFLARWNAKGGDPIPSLFYTYTQDEDANLVIDGAKRLYSDPDVDVDLKLGLLSNISGVAYDSIRLSLIKGGSVEFVLSNIEEENSFTSQILNTVHDIIELDESFGGHLLQAGIIPRLFKLFQTGSEQTRTLIIRTLSDLLKSYSPDRSEKLRKDVVKELTSPTNLPTILNAARAPNPPNIISATYHLISDLLSDTYDEEDPISNLKDEVVDKDLVDALTSHIGTSELSKNAFDLLAQICDGEYRRGQDLVQEAFSSIIPTAQASFFAALLPKKGTGEASSWDARRELITLVLKAGGLERVTDILKETPSDAPAKERIESVLAMRTLIWEVSEEVKHAARRNVDLGRLLASLIADGTPDSMSQASKTVIILHDYSTEGLFDAWEGVLGNAEVAGNLARLMADTRKEVVEEPNTEGLSRDEETRVLEEHQKKEKAASWDYDAVAGGAAELVRDLITILGPYKTQLATALLSQILLRTDSRSAFYTLDAFADEDSSVADFEPLSEAVKIILATKKPTNIREGIIPLVGLSALDISLYFGGVLQYVSGLAKAKEEDKDVQLAAIEVFKPVIARLRARSKTDWSFVEHVLAAQSILIDTPSILKAAFKELIFIREEELELVDEDDEDYLQRTDYEFDNFKWQAIAHAQNLFALLQGSPNGMQVFLGQGSVKDLGEGLLKILDDAECEPEDVGAILGLIVEQLAKESEGEAKSLVASVVNVTKARVEQTTASGGGKGKGKKKRNKKGPKPLSQRELLHRLWSLTRGYRGVGGDVGNSIPCILVESGGLKLALETVLKTKKHGSDETWQYTLGIIGCVASSPLYSLPNIELVSQLTVLLNYLLKTWKSISDIDEAVIPLIIKFLTDIARSPPAEGGSVKSPLEVLLDSQWPTMLIHRLVQSTTSDIDNLASLIVHLIRSGDAGRSAISDVLKAQFQDNAASEIEEDGYMYRGNVYAIERLLEYEPKGEDVDAKAVKDLVIKTLLNAGVVEHALKLLQEQSVKVAAAGARLIRTLEDADDTLAPLFVGHKERVGDAEAKAAAQEAEEEEE